MTSLILCYWIMAMVCLIMRRVFRSFRGLCSYSKARRVFSETPFKESALLKYYKISRRNGFAAFYFTAMFITAIIILRYQRGVDIPVIMIFYFVHVSRRLAESFCVHNFSDTDLNLFAFLAGVSFYVMVPLTYSIASSMTFAELTGIRAHILITVQLIVFYTASLWQNSFHVDLASLRRVNRNSSEIYMMPPFRTVLFPHYSNEIFLYMILASFARNGEDFIFFSLPSVFTAFNLGITATEQREFYSSLPWSEKLPVFNIFPQIF